MLCIPWIIEHVVSICSIFMHVYFTKHFHPACFTRSKWKFHYHISHLLKTHTQSEREREISNVLRYPPNIMQNSTNVHFNTGIQMLRLINKCTKSPFNVIMHIKCIHEHTRVINIYADAFEYVQLSVCMLNFLFL